jgi:lipoprotein-releasing system ATP-binding protein
MSLLFLRSVFKSYNGIPVLDNINLEIRKGEFVGILGPSGSGKSTLLHIAGGLEIPTKGEVRLFGKRIDNLPEEERDKIRRGKLAYIFQFHYLLEDFTVWENIEIFAHLVGKTKDLKTRIEEILKFLRLEHRKKFKPYQLSGGERQRVAIARALIIEPKLIFADEPTGNLDNEQSLEIFNYFYKLNKMGITFLVVTHNEKVLKFFNRVLYLRSGRLSDYTQH